MTCVYTPPQSPSPFSAPSSFLPPRPAELSRRPSALRHASSDPIITHAITRFNQRATVIPDSEQRSTNGSPSSAAASARSEAATKPVPTTRPAPPIPSASAPATTTKATTTNKPPCPPPTRPPPQPLSSSSAGSSANSSGSLLSRRRSSRSAARADVLPMLSDLKLDSLPTAGLEELDDTVRPQVVGESSAAVTPVREALSPSKGEEEVVVVARPFKSTKKIVRTPFPTKRPDWLSDDDEEDEDRGDAPVKTDDGAILGASAGEKWLPLQETSS